MTGLLRQLERARPGYDAERDHHAFLLDSYTGGGGYQGSISIRRRFGHESCEFDRALLDAATKEADRRSA